MTFKLPTSSYKLTKTPPKNSSQTLLFISPFTNPISIFSIPFLFTFTQNYSFHLIFYFLFRFVNSFCHLLSLDFTYLFCLFDWLIGLLALLTVLRSVDLCLVFLGGENEAVN